jgi:dienelactone hydrolase
MRPTLFRANLFALTSSVFLWLSACSHAPQAPSAHSAQPAGVPPPAAAMAAPFIPKGEVMGRATVHTAASAQAVMDQAALVLPATLTGGSAYVGSLKAAPRDLKGKAPVVVFLHGSSGLSLKAIGEWQQWLATLGIASIAPDSFALPDRLTYKSPVDKSIYEQIHALRASEIRLAIEALKNLPWVDSARMVLAGTSEGATSVARYSGQEFAGRIVYSWSCENNYFVTEHRSALPQDRPVLNVMSSTDMFFSASNPWLGNPAAQGHCGHALKDNKLASIVLIPGAPHTLMNLAQARNATAAFFRDLK